jgi:CheY-like chemotaxis protein
VRLEVDMSPDLWPVELDTGELELALLNLAVNARDAMPDGGVFRIVAANEILRAGDVGQPLTGEFVALRISDTGMGIPEDILPKVFDPFFTTKRQGKGTGLGLSQVYGFASQAGGTATIDSELGQGTRILLHLPRSHAGEAAGPAGGEAAMAPEPAQGGAILVVEDNADVAAVTAALLEQLGYRPQIAPSADAALEVLDEGAEFDLVFSDVMMAGDLDGLALARLLRERRPDLPVLLVTGYSEAAEGASREFTLLRKPYQLSELSRTAAGLIALSRKPRLDNLVPLEPRRAARHQKRDT